MAAIIEHSFIGNGVVKLQKGSAAAREVGNCSALSIKFSTDEKKIQDYTRGGGGNANKLTRISSVDVEMDLRELSPDNIALAIQGDVSIDATSKDATIEALTQLGAEYKLTFEGMNEAQGGAKVNVTIHRFKPSPTEDLSLIGDDFATLKLKGGVLVDRSKPAGKSGYFQVVMATQTP